MKRSHIHMHNLAPNSMKRGTRPSALGQRGLSLIELMVGITIGLLVSLAAVGTTTFMRSTFITVNDTTRMQQDASVAMHMIGRQIKQARAIELAPSVGGVRYADYSGPPPFATEAAATGMEGGLTDALTVNTGAFAGATDCRGFGVPVAATVATLSSSFDVDAGALRCRGDALPDAVIDNVEEFQVWYGVRDPATGAIQYHTAAGIVPGGAPDWPDVGSIMVCLRLVGTSRTAPQPPAGAPAFLDCNGAAVAADGRYRQVFRQVFTLRNPA